MKNFLKVSQVAILTLSVFISPTPSFAATTFPDVQKTSWATNAINWGTTNKIIQGYADGSFKPDLLVTGSEFLTMLTRAFKPTNLPNVSTRAKWDEQVWQYAKNMNLDIVTRDKPIDRGTVANVLVGSMGYSCTFDQNIQILLDKKMSKGKFDVSISGFAKDEYLTRTEAIQFIYNAKEEIKELQAKPIKPSTDCPYVESPPFAAEPKTMGDYTLSRTVTDNSQVTLSATLAKDKTVLIVITKGNLQEKIAFAFIDGKLNAPISLNAGQGIYTISVFEGSLSTLSKNTYINVLSDSTAFHVINNDTRDMQYLLPSPYIESNNAEIIELAQEITKNATTDYEKTRAIHEWVINHIDYDVKYYTDPSYVHISYTTRELIARRIGICGDYANVTAALNRAIGIRTKLVIGTTIWPSTGETWDNTDNRDNHEWVEVFVDGRWIIQDPTWDAGYVNLSQQRFVRHVSSKYFDPSEKTFAEDHRKSFDDLE